ncbi:MAG: glycosyltransferase [Bacteroidia bacterium]|nr:glycosyltransferase [Bacteroidia bacterium]NNJ55046.1 glycosyltransferase [Bacteroidia bacterium]
MEQKPRIIATVINDVVYDQRMIRICTSLSKKYNVSLWGRRKSDAAAEKRPFKQKRSNFLIKSGPLFYMMYNIRLFFRLLFTKFDIVHAVDLDTLLAGFLAARIKGKHIVYDSHEYFTEVPELLKREHVRNIWLRIERWIVPKLHYAITVGSKIAEVYTKEYEVSFHVVRNCPELDENFEIVTEPGDYLIYQGALNKGRGIENLILAMREVDFNLKIAGSGDIEESLKLLVKEHNLENKVSFLGLIKPADLKEITTHAYAGINVSENLGLSYYYSLNNKYFDYIHAAIPAVTNAFPEYEKLNNEFDCCVFSDSSPKELVKAIKLLIDDKARYAELKKNCLLARQVLNWQSEEKELLSIYANIT